MAMKELLTGIAKLTLGVLLALILLSFAGVATARYFMAKLSVLPPKPSFDNDFGREPAVQTAAAVEPTTPAVPVSPEPQPVAVAEPPPGSYEAVVVQPIGLILRAGSGLDYEQIGGVDYNEQVLVLKTSEDGRWLNVQVQSGQVGWVKAGNTQSLGN